MFDKIYKLVVIMLLLFIAFGTVDWFKDAVDYILAIRIM